MDVNVHLLPAEKWILSHNIFIWKKCPCLRPFAFVQLGCALGFNRIRLSNQSGYEYLAWQQFREKEREGGRGDTAGDRREPEPGDTRTPQPCEPLHI